MTEREITASDRVLLEFDRALRILFQGKHVTARPSPAADQHEAGLTDRQIRHVQGLMRVNHAGEVAAQALYHGQALTARSDKVRKRMRSCADEEIDHLGWCELRLGELGGGTSKLGPLWYAGSFAIGAANGLVGDKWSLGFVAETEKQVVEHLDEHLRELPDTDAKSRAVLEQMRIDEQEHGKAAGGAPLPRAVQTLMRRAAKVMTRLAYRI